VVWHLVDLAADDRGSQDCRPTEEQPSCA
jgi:hypothetical protein